MPLSPLAALKVDEWEKMVDVNIKGVLYGVAAVLPIMKQQESGHIINLSSVAGHQVFPSGVVYCATKFAVKAISEGIRLESDGDIRATNISPGAVDTELTSTISHKESAKMPIRCTAWQLMQMRSLGPLPTQLSNQAMSISMR